ncbi:potassium channel family protein [Micromonospora sp. NPDC092111]|uniref:potassium channel family protein n=1 Tax=Micromonospora sp. NPDC092111 TaxID=3364289 RepID=UPI00380042AF
MGERAAPKDPGRGVAAPDRYGLVLALLTVSFLLTAFLPGDRTRPLPLLLYLAALTLALRSAHPDRPGSRRLLWVLAVPSAVAVVLLVVAPIRVVHGLVSLWMATILALAIVAVVRRVLAHPVVTLQTIFGALSAYLLIGFFYAALFAALAQFQGTPLFADGQPASNNTIQYFSFITMTTVGYGDFTAASEPGRTLAVFDALTGQIFLLTLVARLVSTFGIAPRGQ